ncbi:M1 family peptidase, partial [Streptomyces sp. B1866]|nr:M1 family peptidase [Streptomyces sp. B1866]
PLGIDHLVGEEVFTRVEHAFLARHRNSTASTRDFIALASEVSGQDLTGFLTEWLYGTKTPRMPGHPDWTVNPVTPAARYRRPAGGHRLHDEACASL